MANIRELSDAGPDGTRLGQSSTDKVAFYGATPAVRPATSAAVVVSTAITGPSATAAATSTGTNWGYTTSTQADAIPVAINSLIARVASLVVTVNTLRTNLATLGIEG